MRRALLPVFALFSAACSKTSPPPPAPAVASATASPVPSASVAAAASAASAPTVTPVAIAQCPCAVGFDDLRFAQGSVVAPAGCTGEVALVDPGTSAVARATGFAKVDCKRGGHDDGPTSADATPNGLVVTDRTAKKLDVLDPSTHAIVASAPLAAGPDYVRFVGKTGEAWVTEPEAEQIEIFALGANPPKRAATMKVPNGPESLVVDEARGMAYTNEWKGSTLAIDLAKRAVVARWPNGCDQARGIALDAARSLVFVACKEGKAVVLDAAHDGKVVSTGKSGDGVDVIDYSPRLGHLYVPGAKSATMGIFAVGEGGTLALLGEVKTAAGAHCVVADDRGQAWVCDPQGGRLLRVNDPYGATPR